MPACVCGVAVRLVHMEEGEAFLVDRTETTLGTRYRMVYDSLDGLRVADPLEPMLVEKIPDRIEASGFRRHDETCSRR